MYALVGILPGRNLQRAALDAEASDWKILSSVFVVREWTGRESFLLYVTPKLTSGGNEGCSMLAGASSVSIPPLTPLGERRGF